MIDTLLVEFLKWFFICMAILGAYEGTRPNSNNLKMNLLFMTSNLFSAIYFTIPIPNWPYMTRNLVFLCMSFVGVYRNWKRLFEPSECIYLRNDLCRVDGIQCENSPFEARSGYCYLEGSPAYRYELGRRVKR